MRNTALTVSKKRLESHKFVYYKHDFILLLLLLNMIMGENIPLNIDVMGLNFTVYRVLTPIIFVFFLFSNIGKKDKSGSYKWLICTVSIWIAYGIILLVISPFSDLHPGMKELMYILLGVASSYIIWRLINNILSYYRIIRIIKFILFFMLLLGWIEIFLNYHLPTSRIVVENLQSYRSFLGIKIYTCTSIFYNPNDYSAFLAIFVPIVCYGKQTEKDIAILFIEISAVVQILIDGATICFFAIFISYVVHYMLLTKKIEKKIVIITGITLIVVLLDMLLSSGVFVDMSIGGEIKNQLTNNARNSGSMYKRITIYKDAILTLPVTKGCGLGPGSFTLYFTKHHSASWLVNPHNMWLEILSEYGVAIFTLYLIMYITYFRRLILAYKKTGNNIYVTLHAGLCSFALACMAPSTFLQYSYTWLMWGLVTGALKISSLSNKHNYKKHFFLGR